jgi:hypothetical protein
VYLQNGAAAVAELPSSAAPTLEARSSFRPAQMLESEPQQGQERGSPRLTRLHRVISLRLLCLASTGLRDAQGTSLKTAGKWHGSPHIRVLTQDGTFDAMNSGLGCLDALGVAALTQADAARILHFPGKLFHDD